MKSVTKLLHPSCELCETKPTTLFQYWMEVFPFQKNPKNLVHLKFLGLLLTLLHSEQPKLYRVLAVLSTVGLKEKLLL